MRYRFFICKSKDYCENLVSWTLRKHCATGACSAMRRDLLLPFDMEKLAKVLADASGELEGVEPNFRFRRVSDLPLVAVYTEYGKAQAVAEILESCIGDLKLKVFDGEMDCGTRLKAWEREQFIATRIAYQRHRLGVLDKLQSRGRGGSATVISLFKLGECHYGIGDAISSQFSTIDTSISLLRGDLHRGIAALHRILQEGASGHEEKVYCKNGCFVVENEKTKYRLRFVLEGCGKSPLEMGWMENDEIKTVMLRRMGVYQARKLLEKEDEGGVEYACSRMYFPERIGVRGEWRNPADRFVGSCKIFMHLKKQNLDITYGRHPRGRGGHFWFYICDEEILGWDTWKTSSFFDVPEDDVEPLLAVFESVVPYYYEYYYDKFHFRKEEVDQILDRIKEVRPLIIADPCDPVLGEMVQRLLNSTFAWEYPDGRRAIRYDEDEKREILRQNRLRVVALLDFFAWWIEEQRDDSRMWFNGFYVDGP